MKTMHKIILSILTIVCLTFSLSAFANPNDLQTLSGSSNSKDLRPDYCWETYIPIKNKSSSTITFRVPGTHIAKTLFPGESDEITSKAYFFAILVVVYDDDGIVIFRDYVPNNHILEIKDVYYKTRSTGDKKQLKVEVVSK